MSFRDQREHLQHKNELLERELQEKERQLQEERDLMAGKKKQRRAERWKNGWTSLKTGSVVAIVFCFGCAVFGGATKGVLKLIDVVAEMEAQRQIDAIIAHREMLVRMRENVPRGVDPATWLWCVDRCSRYGRPRDASGNQYAEGVVVDTFVNYQEDPPIELMTVQGPWLNAEAETRVTYTVGDEEVDPPAARFSTGDLVRISTMYDHKGHFSGFTFRQIHME